MRPTSTLEVLIHPRHSGWDNGIPVTCWDVYVTNMLLGLVSAMVGNVTIFNNYTCAFMIPKGYYAPLTVPSVTEADAFIATNCIYRVAWAINHDPWYMQIDWNAGVVFLNTQYINWPINSAWIWIGTLQHTTPAWTYLFQEISFKVPVTKTPTVTTSVATVTKVIIPSYVIYVAVAVVAVVTAVVAIILVRRR